MRKEQHLFIIWHNAYQVREKIIHDIQQKFITKGVVEIVWSERRFADNLSRFYGGKLPPGSKKEGRIGHGPFTLIIVEDVNPVYGERLVSGRRMQQVNINLFDAKMRYRDWAEGPEKVSDRVHATNTLQETSHDLTLLMGCTPEDYVASLSSSAWDGSIKKLQKDLVGAEGWSNLQEFFYVLNATICYIVVRKFESLPEKYPLAHEEDIDLLVDNYKEACWIMNAKPVCREPYRILNETIIAGERVRFDLRYIGDNYYDKQWEEALLKNRIFNRGFFRINDTDAFYTLLYHAFIQKPAVSNAYQHRLTEMACAMGINATNKSVLDDYMHTMRYKYTKPIDKSVCFNEECAFNYNQNRLLVFLYVCTRRIKKAWGKVQRRVQSLFLKKSVGKSAT